MNDERAANAIDKKLGQRVRSRRIEIGMSQEKLAEILGVTFQQVQKYEKGVNRIAASRMLDICAALDVSVSRLYEGMQSPRAPGAAEPRQDNVEDALSTPEGAQLLSIFASIESVRVRRRVVELVKVLAEEAVDKGKRG
jgi:transcriptional regulator with XRE-family HTH domain